MQVAVESLKNLSRPITKRKEKAQVATISAHNDESIGELVAETLERVGAEGAISVEEAKTTETSLEVVEGMQFERGYLSPYFVTDAEKMEVSLEDPYILLANKRVSNMHDLLGLLEQVAKSGNPLVVIAEDVDGEALAALVVNNLRGVLHGLAVKAPGFGDRRLAILQDIAVLTHGVVLTDELGIKVFTICTIILIVVRENI